MGSSAALQLLWIRPTLVHTQRARTGTLGPMAPTYLARVERDDHTGQVTLTVIRDTDVVELHEGDEFVTIVTPQPLFSEE